MDIISTYYAPFSMEPALKAFAYRQKRAPRLFDTLKKTKNTKYETNTKNTNTIQYKTNSHKND